MPSLDGLDVCRAARGTLPSRSMGIVFLSARSGERDVARGIGAGADAYVKPFSWEELLGPIERVLSAQRQGPELEPGLSAA